MILDTTFLIDLLKNNKEAVSKARELEKSFDPVLTTTVSVFEVWQGVRETAREKEKIHQFLASLGILPLDLDSAFVAGGIRRNLAGKGEIIEPEDCMIAGITLKNKETLLTRNAKHFERIPELRVETY